MASKPGMLKKEPIYKPLPKSKSTGKTGMKDVKEIYAPLPKKKK